MKTKEKLLWFLFIIGILFLISGGYVLFQNFGIFNTLEIIKKLPNNFAMLIGMAEVFGGLILMFISLNNNKVI